MEQRNKLNMRIWLSFILFGLAGQVAWAIENMYLNLFMYRTITTDPFWIALMVASSAVVATLTTLIMGAWSDRLGKRRIFLCAGYFLWGISVILFSASNTSFVAKLFPNSAHIVELTAIFLIILDLIMTFFGSTANDAVFNAYVAEMTTREYRGKIEGLLSSFPLLAMLLVFGILDPIAQGGKWNVFFLIVGVATALLGLLGFVVLPQDKTKPSTTGVWANLRYAFSREAFLENPVYYAALGLLFVVSVSMQVYMPYIIIYIQEFLGFDDYAILLGVVLIASSIVSILAGRLIDRKGFLYPFPYFFTTALVGLVGMFFVRSMVYVGIAVFIMLASYLVLTTIATATLREYTPEGKAGRFQGIRMIFCVMLPMIIGPFVGSALFTQSDAVYLDLGSEKKVPTPNIYLGAAVILLFSLYFYFSLRKKIGRGKLHEREQR
ncbi:MAG: MFS transporter [Saccharofermentanales bacterium]|nr:MFS transporter [Clostridiaceae bacterium]